MSVKPMSNNAIHLRKIEPDDLPRLYEFNLEPDGNRLAMTIPRSADAFAARWENNLDDPNVVARAILVGDTLAGSIVCFYRDGMHEVGYWLGQEFWGNGIASRALNLLLRELTIRPIHARVATSNQPSLRALQKCGFVIEQIRMSPATERFLECEETLLVLK